MSERLEGTAAIVTGASSGIGQAAALRLAAEGAQLTLVARRRDRLEELAAQIGKAVIVEADITHRDQAQAAIDATLAEYGRIDTLVNNAGVMLNGATLEVPLDDWDRMVDINVKGLMYMTKLALPHLLEAVGTSPRGVADVVNISSVAGRQASAEVALYNATKFGVTAATEAWRQEFTKRSLRFSVVEPGAVATELMDHQGPSGRARSDRMFAGVEKLLAEDIAEAIAYIVTNPRRVAINEIVIRPTDQA
jgi:NADP-dependent 3-hydroxy acid dehydrogenase YdfG